MTKQRGRRVVVAVTAAVLGTAVAGCGVRNVHSPAKALDNLATPSDEMSPTAVETAATPAPTSLATIITQPTPTPQATPAPSPAPAQPPSLAVHLLPAGDFVDPQFVTLGLDGSVWFTSTQPSYGVVARMAPDGTVTRFTPAAKYSSPYAITTTGDGAIWFTETPGSGTGSRFGRIAPDGTMREFAGPAAESSPNPNTLDLATGIVGGPNGDVWFSEGERNRIGRMTPDGTLTEYPIPGASCCSRSPLDLRLSDDGTMWFHLGDPHTNIGTAAPYQSRAPITGIGRITTSGVITLYLVPEAPGVGASVRGPDGTRWTMLTSGAVRCVTASGTAVTSPPDGYPSYPYLHLVVGADRRAWWIGSANQLVSMDAACKVTRYALAFLRSTDAVQDLVSGPGSRVTLADTGGGDIGWVTAP